ncbi:MAG: hypothetical protein IT376_17840 [Polyangiaceae bacterium]|nr:hypothetical protein [Polyangiaceae bacterium]
MAADDDRAPASDRRPLAYQAVAPPPAEIGELVAAAVGWVAARVGVPPDFTRETLPLVDHYLLESREAIAERPETLPLVARAVGAYFGEVIRVHVDTFWITPSADAHTWRIAGRTAMFSVNPVGMAWDALVGGADHDGPESTLAVAPEERDVVDERLARLAPVPEDEFLRLSTRLEVLELVAETLRATMQTAGVDDVVFDESDYGVVG